jgi:hypothetical protein
MTKEWPVCFMCLDGRCEHCYNYWDEKQATFICECAEANHHGKAPVPVRASCHHCAQPLSKPGQSHYGCDGTRDFGEADCLCNLKNHCAELTKARNTQRLCESCHGKGYSWMKDKRLPWVSEGGYYEKTDMTWDALFCLSCAPCPACQPKDHEKWQVYYKKSLSVLIALGDDYKTRLTTDEQRAKYQEMLKHYGVEGYVLDQPPEGVTDAEVERAKDDGGRTDDVDKGGG